MPIIIERDKQIKVNYDDKDIKPANYPMNDLMSVFTHWDNKLKRNVPTENK